MPRHQEKEEKDASQKEENLPNLLAASFFWSMHGRCKLVQDSRNRGSVARSTWSTSRNLAENSGKSHRRPKSSLSCLRFVFCISGARLTAAGIGPRIHPAKSGVKRGDCHGEKLIRSLQQPIYSHVIRCSLATQQTFGQSVKDMAGRGELKQPSKDWRLILLQMIVVEKFSVAQLQHALLFPSV